MIMNYKKYTYKMTVVSILMLFALGLVFFTSSSGLSSENEQSGDIFPLDNPANDQPLTMVEIDQPPRVIRAVRPKYPLEAEEGISGQVLLILVVGADGYAHEPEVVTSELEDVFDEAALDAVAEYRFQPALKDGKPVDCIVKIPIKFGLDK